MPICTIPDTDTHYYLICFDEHGRERQESDGSLLSESVAKLIGDRSENISDVFFASHGWKGDVPAAIQQYDRWVGEMVRYRNRPDSIVPDSGFKAIVIGLHWPSLPFGDEEMVVERGLLSGDVEPDIDRQVGQYAASISDSPSAMDAIRTIITAAQHDTIQDDRLPSDVRLAYETLYAEAFPGFLGGTLGSPPGANHGDWHPDAIYQEALTAEGPETEMDDSKLLGGGVWDKFKRALLAPLRQLSFWKMKDRARRIGEGGGHALLGKLQQAASSDTRFHLMGHSFGCIVVSSAVAGPPGVQSLARAVDSLFLVQGALSLWSFCPDIPYSPGESGYLNRIISGELVRGPIVTTRSKYDTAVGKLYPPAAKISGDLVLDDDLPRYGGLGAFGARGLGDQAEDINLQSPTAPYGFKPGRVYNIDASRIIKNGGGFSGAHNDIAHPEVAHAMWEAILVNG
ncbi:MAG: hypothetical protein ACYS8Z_08720 [Planctomycetota bacterium]|jgi:hypothetical protein